MLDMAALMSQGEDLIKRAPPDQLQPWFARATALPPGRAAIIGGGIAGASTAHALRRRGWQTTIIDRRKELAQEASGNPTGVLMPRLTAAPNLDGRFYAAAWRFVLRTLVDIGMQLDAGGVLQLATDAAEAARQNMVAADAALPPAMLRQMDAAAASDIAGCALPFGALHFPQGGAIDPRAYCAALAQGSDVLFGVDVARLRHDGRWQVIDAAGEVRTEVDIVVLANALGAASLPQTAWLPLAARRGALTLAPPTPASAALRAVLAYGGYMTPARGGVHSIGATFDWISAHELNAPPVVRGDDHARNLADLAHVLPGLMAGVEPRALAGRAALRCTTADHMPVVGPVPDEGAYRSDFAELRHGHPWARYPGARYVPGLYVLTGLGARGLVSAPLAAEILAAHVTGESWPVENDLTTALHPGRFLVRELKRGV